MMEVTTLRSYRLEFAKRAEERREDQRRVLDRVKQKEEREKKEERDRDIEREALLDTVIVAMVSDTELASFEIENDLYKTTTVEALIENEEKLRLVDEELKTLLDQAYVLPDGRRVFKTKDGTRVFDEHLVEVRDIDPDEIEDWRPHAERYEGPFKRKLVLTEERENLVEFQKLTDNVDAEIAEAKRNGGMPSERLQELRAKLAEEAPDAVKAKMSRNSPDQDAELAATPKADNVFRPAGKLDVPAL